MKSSLITYCLLLITCYSSSFFPLTPWKPLTVQAQTVEVEKIRAQQLLQQGIEQAKTNQLEAALQSFQGARIIYQGIQDFSGEGQALNYLSLVYSSLKDYTKAIDYQQQVLAIARSLEDPNLEWSALSTLVSFFTQIEDEQKIIEFAQQGLILARESQNSQWKWAALSTLASTYSSLENYEKVVEYAQQGLIVAQKVQNPNYEVLALVFLSEAHNLLGDSQKALELGQEGLAIARKISNSELEAWTLLVLGNVNVSLRNYSQGIELVQKGLEIAQASSNRNLESNALFSLALIHWTQGDYQQAIDYGQQSLAIYRELGDHESELIALHNLNTNYIYLGDYQKVIELTQEELALAKQVKNYDYEGIALVYLGFAHFAQGDIAKILEYGQQALAVGKEKQSITSEHLALIALSIGYSNSGNNQQALELAQNSLAIARNPQHRHQLLVNAEELSLNTLGSLYRKVGQQKEAITVYQETLAIDQHHFTAQVGLARSYRELNLPLTAITYYKQAISNIEQIRGNITGLDRQLQESFLQAILVDADGSNNTDIYRELADLLLSQGRILEAQQVLELLKAEELREYTRTGEQRQDVSFTDTESAIIQEHGTLVAFGQKLVDCQRHNCPQKEELIAQRQVLTEEFNQAVRTIETEIRDRQTKDYNFLNPRNDFNRKAQEIIKAQPGTVLIYPFVLADKLWLLIASEGGVVKKFEVEVGQQQLGETVLRLRQLLATPNSSLSEVQKTSQQLYSWLIQPLEAELQGSSDIPIQHLIFALDQVTRYIPMSALFDGQQYLIENYTVSTIVSADTTNTTERLPNQPQAVSVLALGLSDAVAGFNPLKNVPEEIDAIVQRDSQDSKGVYPGLEFLNQDFNLDALQNNLYGRQILHVATHGEFVPGSFDDSYLLLGTGDKLAIPEIENLNDLTDVHLVVLSACETALGEPGQDGVEIAGISHYFLARGAESVLASLWQVNDASTSLLMQQFYNSLVTGTKAEALRQAQLQLLQSEATVTTEEERATIGVESPDKPLSQRNLNSKFSHPYYWASFIMIGNSL